MLLDAGAGDRWRYLDRELQTSFARSEGLAVASFRMYQAGGFSSDALKEPFRADAVALASLEPEALAQYLQASGQNPLVGLEGRAALLRALGREIARKPGIFGAGAACRLGGLYDYLKEKASTGADTLPAREILIGILDSLNGAWPSGLEVDGVLLGDVGHHPGIRRDDRSDGLVPFHKLSQWLAYSLVEPLEEAGIRVTDLDQLTGLPEYRNGGLFVDTGVMVPRSTNVLGRSFSPTSELVVEWRAMTVALLDKLADLVRTRLGRDRQRLPLAAVLQGGTWATGRQLAQQRRGGRPPIEIASDGTIF